MIPVVCTSKFEPDPRQELEASGPFTKWVDSLPGWATLAPIIHDAGSQRDPHPILVGMKATWTEER